MIKIDPTSSSPEVGINQSEFKMIGVCTPENPPVFFETFKKEFDALIGYKEPIKLTFHLDYFNTGSSKCLLNLFKSITQRFKNLDTKIIWMYEAGDEEMLESGELYAEIAEIKFELMEIK
jgi:hypothetical protein